MPGSAKRKGSPTSAPATPPVKASKADASNEEVPEAASPSGGTLLGASDAAAAKRTIPAAIAAMAHAACKHSGYRVGACILSESGKAYSGCNVESDSYGLTVCAERVALFKALSEGERSFTHLSCATANGGIACGACRQMLSEYCPQTMETLFVNAAGEVTRRTTVGEMLPDPFVL